MSTLKVGVVGANGFIGRHLVAALDATEGISVHQFGRAQKAEHNTTLPYIQIDLQHIHKSTDDLKGFDVVYYLASETIPASSWQQPLLELERNLKPFIQFCEILAQHETKKIVFVSSAGTVYGPSEERLTEEAATKPFSPYGIVKLAMENFLNYFQKKYNLNFDVYRVSNVFGDGQDVSKGLGIINTFLEKILTERKVVIYGSGDSVRNYIYVKDVAALLCLSVIKPFNDSETYNLASSDTLSINDLVKIITDLVEEKFEVQYHATRQSDNPAIYLDNTKILNALPTYKPTPLSQGISQTYHFLKNNLV